MVCVMEIRMLRYVSEVTREDKIINWNSRGKLWVTLILRKLKKNIIRLSVHVMKINDEQAVRFAMIQ